MSGCFSMRCRACAFFWMPRGCSHRCHPDPASAPRPPPPSELSPGALSLTWRDFWPHSDPLNSVVTWKGLPLRRPAPWQANLETQTSEEMGVRAEMALSLLPQAR